MTFLRADNLFVNSQPIIKIKIKATWILVNSNCQSQMKNF
jgi:hypothetical protein